MIELWYGEVKGVDVTVGAGWAGAWRSIGEYNILIGLDVRISPGLVEIDLGLLIGGLSLEFDW